MTNKPSDVVNNLKLSQLQYTGNDNIYILSVYTCHKSPGLKSWSENLLSKRRMFKVRFTLGNNSS